MTHNFKIITTVISFLLLLSPVCKGRVFDSITNSRTADSIKVANLIDSAKNLDINFNKAIQLSHKASKIAKQSGVKTYYAESLLATGVVLYNNSMADSALNYFYRAANIFEVNNSTSRLIVTYEDIAFANIGIHKYKKAIKYATLGLHLADSAEDNSHSADLYFALGTSFQYLGSYTKSIEALMSSLNLYEADHDSLGISSTLINIGLILASDENYSSALNYTNRALKICENIKDKYGESICLNNIGDFYSSSSKYEKALSFYKRSLEIDERLDDDKGIAIDLNNIGDIYKHLHDTTLALSYYANSLDIAKQNNYEISSIILQNIGEIQLNKHNFRLALKYALKSVKVAESTQNIKHLLSSYTLLYKCYAATGNYVKAYSYSILSKKISDSIYSISKSKNIQQVVSTYNFKQQNVEINQLNKLKIANYEYRMHLIYIIVIITIILLVMIIAAGFIRKAKNNFKSQKRYYEKLIDRSEDFIFVVSREGITKYISPSYQRKIGRNISDRIGKDAFEFIHPDDVNIVKQEFAKLSTEGQLTSLEFRMQNAYGSWINVLAYGQNLLDDPIIEGIIVNFWDTTQIKKDEDIIRKNELRYRQIFNSFPDIYFQMDMMGVITEISPSVEKIIGFASEEVIGLKPNEYSNLIGDWNKIIAKLKANSIVHDFDTKIIVKDGGYKHCSLTVEYIFSEDGNPIWLKGVVRDITTRKENQEKLSISEKELKVANKSKEMLLSIISHDLIGPIGTNKSIVDLIVDQINVLSIEEIVSLVTSLKPSLDSTFSLIENLLSWSRIQQKRIKIHLEKFLINKLISNIVLLLKSQANRKSINLIVKSNRQVTLLADKNQIDIALRNLISNAIKFSNRGDDITIAILGYTTYVEIKIIDSGIGINQQQINDIISGSISTDVRRGTNNEKGTGFGLVIVNEFIKNNKGKLDVQGEVGEGTTFTITLPIIKQ